MTALKAGTQALTRRGAPRAGFTQENLAQLEKMKVKTFKTGVASRKYVNHMLTPDGSVVPDTQGEQMKAAARALAKEVLKGDTTDPKVLRAAAVMAEKVQEIDAHVAEKRFLFIVDVNMIPVVYFQTDVPHNPDREEWK